MDRFQHSAPSLEELRQIQYEARSATSVRHLRTYFDRVQELRRIHQGDFDVQLLVAEAQEEIISRARELQRRSAPSDYDGEPATRWQASAAGEPVLGAVPEPDPEAAEIPPEVPRMDKRSWRYATFLALFLTALICIAFFYLIQSARKLNLSTPAETAPQAKPPAANSGQQPAANATPASAAAPSSPAAPSLRLYTDLVPGTVSVDDEEPQNLKDGELILDHLETGRHSIKIAGRSGSASFSFDVEGTAAPQVVGMPVAANALAVLVSAQDGKARLISSTQPAAVTVDGKAAGQVTTDALPLDDLGTTDHEFQIGQGKDRQRFVLTYTAGPSLTAYVKSDPNAGLVVISTAQDGVSVLINGKPYRRKTDHGQLRIPLKVGTYSIAVHKDGFIDPPEQGVDVKKAEESALTFNLAAMPNAATLEIRGAAPGTAVYLDRDLAVTVGVSGTATVSSVKPGDHAIELRLDGSAVKRLERRFQSGESVLLTGPDVVLERPPAEKPAPATAAPAAAAPASNTPVSSADVSGERVQKGGGFVPYNVPRTAGHYSFQARSHIGGFLKHNKLQWYAGYQDSQNYVLFILDGKRASVRQVRDGKSTEVSRVPFNIDSDRAVQVDLGVKPGSISARVRTPDGAWSDLGSVSSEGQDFTQGKVGFYLPGNDEVAVSNFRFSSHP